jgi:hypothetical protein
MPGQPADTQSVRQALGDGNLTKRRLERLLDQIDAREAEFHSVLGVTLYAKETAEQDAARLRADLQQACAWKSAWKRIARDYRASLSKAAMQYGFVLNWAIEHGYTESLSVMVSDRNCWPTINDEIDKIKVARWLLNCFRGTKEPPHA